MTEKSYLLVSAGLFGLIGFGHLLRLIFEVPVQFGIWTVPAWPSVFVVVLASALFVWALRLLRSG